MLTQDLPETEESTQAHFHQRCHPTMPILVKLQNAAWHRTRGGCHASETALTHWEVSPNPHLPPSPSTRPLSPLPK